MTRETLVKRVAKLLKAGFRVRCVYAGPTGFALARELIALGAECIVVRACKLERYGRRRKNDKRDSRQLALDLALYCAGRTGLLLPVRVPTPGEELHRLPSREREALSDVRHQLLRSARGPILSLSRFKPETILFFLHLSDASSFENGGKLNSADLLLNSTSVSGPITTSLVSA